MSVEKFFVDIAQGWGRAKCVSFNIIIMTRVVALIDWSSLYIHVLMDNVRRKDQREAKKHTHVGKECGI